MLTANAGMISDFLQAQLQNGGSKAACAKLLSQCLTDSSFHGTHLQVLEEGLRRAFVYESLSSKMASG